MNEKSDVLDSIVALCKRRGFIFPGSDIYGGLAGTWDYGHLGLMLKNNIKRLWWKRFVEDRDDMYGVDAAILMNQKTWEASGHVGGFADPMVECKKCKNRFRADQIKASGDWWGSVSKELKILVGKASVLPDVATIFREYPQLKNVIWICSECGEKDEAYDLQQFNMMFKTHVGASQDSASVSYLRPETAQGMFVNFKNILDTEHPKLPFGLAQIGKAFRNEIAPRDFLFRSREFEQMEIEYFVKPDKWEEAFEHFKKEMHAFTVDVGLIDSKVHELEVADGDRAHYSKRTIDFEYDWPFGRKELYGLAYRTDFDLKQHSEFSKVDLSYYDEETKERLIPHCIEPSFGLDRTVLAVLTDAYTEDSLGAEEVDSDKLSVVSKEKRVFLRLSPNVAPYRVAVFPLLRNKPALVEKAQEIYKNIKKVIPNVDFDDNGNIGKRYRRQDEIGTPYCVTVDFDTIEKDAGVTVRDRDTGKQERVGEEELIDKIMSSVLLYT